MEEKWITQVADDREKAVDWVQDLKWEIRKLRCWWCLFPSLKSSVEFQKNLNSENSNTFLNIYNLRGYLAVLLTI